MHVAWLVYVRSYCVPVATLNQNKGTRLLYLGAAQIKKHEMLQCGEKLVATKMKISGRNTCNLSFLKRVTRTFLEVSRCSRAKQWQRNVQKLVCFAVLIAFTI